MGQREIIMMVCDRCGKEVETSSSKIEVRKWSILRIFHNKGGHPFHVWDICEDCSKEQVMFITHDQMEADHASDDEEANAE